jgi:hypothetical protein
VRPRSRALLTLPLACLVLALTSLWTSGPATAGGPTSVLLSVPGEGRMAALYYTDAQYDALNRLVGVVDTREGQSGPLQSHETGQVVTLTWLIHDVQVWRVDRVMVGGGGAPWVETREVLDAGAVWDAPPVWHQADRRLTALLARVLPERGSATSGVAASPLDLAAEAPLTDAAPPADASTDEAASALRGGASSGSPLTALTWAAAGVLVGGVLTSGLLRHQQRRRPGVTEDRSVADQLAWP